MTTNLNPNIWAATLTTSSPRKAYWPKPRPSPPSASSPGSWSRRCRPAASSKSALAKQMHTSRAAVDGLLDPASPSVTLLTLERAAQVLGRRLVVSLT